MDEQQLVCKSSNGHALFIKSVKEFEWVKWRTDWDDRIGHCPSTIICIKAQRFMGKTRGYIYIYMHNARAHQYCYCRSYGECERVVQRGRRLCLRHLSWPSGTSKSSQLLLIMPSPLFPSLQTTSLSAKKMTETGWMEAQNNPQKELKKRSNWQDLLFSL